MTTPEKTNPLAELDQLHMQAYRELLAHIKPHAAGVEAQPGGRFAWFLTVAGPGGGEFRSEQTFATAEEAVLEMVARAKTQGVDADPTAAEALSTVVEHAQLVQKFENERKNAVAFADAAVAQEKKKRQVLARIVIVLVVVALGFAVFLR